MSFTLDYDDPIPSVVKRLRGEHDQLDSKLSQIYRESNGGDLKVAISLLRSIRNDVLRHAVEEEARLMRAIMWELGSESLPSISIMRWHREIANFFKNRLPKLATLPDAVARREVQIFVNELRKHHREEEESVFPLALKADALGRKQAGKTKPKFQKE